MSPEQCRAEKPDLRSDIYSLGIIAYQMLSGGTPFSGDFTEVMESHKSIPPPPLNAKKVRKKLKRVINSVLERSRRTSADRRGFRKYIDVAFGGHLRPAPVCGYELYRAYSQISRHCILLYLPFVLASVLNVLSSVLFIDQDDDTPESIAMKVAFTLLTLFTGFFCGYLIIGTTTWLVNQILSFPLRPVRIRPASLRHVRIGNA